MSNFRQLNESLDINNWDKIKKYVIEKCFNDGELDYIINDYDIDYYLNSCLINGHKQKLMDKLNIDNDDDLIRYISDNYDEGISHQIYLYLLNIRFEENRTCLINEFEEDDRIYRKISMNENMNDLIELLNQRGTGNCWAKQEKLAESYYGGMMHYEYILVGEANMNNVNWEKTIYLRMVNESENEIRLKKDFPIKMIKIKYEEYDGNQVIETGEVPYEIYLNTGSKYSY